MAWPLDNKPVAYRASMLPIGNYADGSIAFPVWPQGAVDAWEALGRFHRGEAPQPQDAVLAGLVMSGGVAGGLGRGARAVSGKAPAPLAAPVSLPSHSVEAGSPPPRGIAPQISELGIATDAASRTQRAKELGFDTDTTWYHGTASDVGSFRPSSHGVTGPGVYMTTSPRTAAWFADADFGPAAIYPLRVRGQFMPFEEYQGLVAKLQNSVDWMGQPDALSDAIKQAITEAGYVGVRKPNIDDPGSFVASVINPKNIRSVNAAFDPAKADSANILAVNAPEAAAAGLLPMGGEGENGQEDFMTTLLRKYGYLPQQMAAASYEGSEFKDGPIEPMTPVPTPAPIYTGTPPQWWFNLPPGNSMVGHLPQAPRSDIDRQEQADRLRQWPRR